jgi:hypothetical protein
VSYGIFNFLRRQVLRHYPQDLSSHFPEIFFRQVFIDQRFENIFQITDTFHCVRYIEIFPVRRFIIRLVHLERGAARRDGLVALLVGLAEGLALAAGLLALGLATFVLALAALVALALQVAPEEVILTFEVVISISRPKKSKLNASLG